eukprot:862113-Prymnesium_polylepis.2
MALVAEQPSAHSRTVYSVAFSPDGTRIVSGSHDNSVKVWGGQRLPELYCCVLAVAVGVQWAVADDVVRDAVHRRVEYGAGGREAKRSPETCEVRGLLAGRHKDRVGL